MATIADLTIPIARLAEAGPGRVLLGANDEGQDVVWHRDYSPHLRVSGETGKGKSVAVNTICAHDIAAGNILVHVDPKPGGAGWLAPYAHVATTTDGHAVALGWLVAEMQARQRLCATHELPDGSVGVPDIGGLGRPLPRVVAIIEEMGAVVGDLAYLPGPGETRQEASERVEANQARVAAIATRGRSAGVHLVGVTQYPTVEATFGAGRMGGAISGQFGARLHLDAIDISLRATFNKGDGVPSDVLRTIRAGRRGRGAYVHLDPADGGRVRAVQVWDIDRAALAELAATATPPDPSGYITPMPGRSFDLEMKKEFGP